VIGAEFYIMRRLEGIIPRKNLPHGVELSESATMSGVAEDVAKEAMRLAAHKLPIRTKFITKHDMPDHVEEIVLDEMEAVKPEIVHEEPAPVTDETGQETENDESA
jgi:hypothetical protein